MNSGGRADDRGGREITGKMDGGGESCLLQRKE